MKSKDANISLRISSKIKKMMLNNNIKAQSVFDLAVLKELRKINLNKEEAEEVLREFKKWERKNEKLNE